MAGDALHFRNLMARDDNGPAFRGETDHASQELAPHQEIEARSRLVKNQDFGIHGRLPVPGRLWRTAPWIGF